jgi:hypothetical protein
MAVNYSNYPAYRAAVEKVQKLQNRLNGPKGTSGTGLVDAMDRLAASKGETSPEYLKVKAEFDKVQIELESATASAKTMRESIDAQELKKSTEKNAGKKKVTDDATVKALEFQRDSLKRQNKTEEAAAKQAEIDAIRSPVTEEEKAAAGDITIEEDKFSEYTLTDGIVTAKGGPQVIFVDVVDGNGNTVPTAYKSKAQAREAFLKNYAGKDQITSLQNQLLQSNYIKQSQITDGSWINGLDSMLIARTAKMVSDVKYGLGSITSAEDFLKTKRESGSTTRTYRDLSTRGDARQQIDDYLTDLTGSKATEEEYETYYKLLSAEERRQTMTTSGGTRTGDVMTDVERFVIAAKVARNRLKNTDVDVLLSSSKGSQIAMDISALQEMAADYGIDMTAAEALKQVTIGIGQKNYLEKQQERLKLIAKKMHPGLADHIDAGGSVLDIANTYARAKFNKLGVVIKSPTKDKDVMDAVASGKSMAQFDKEMQANPMWRFTDEARDTASDFLDTIGRMWGRG